MDHSFYNSHSTLCSRSSLSSQSSFSKLTTVSSPLTRIESFRVPQKKLNNINIVPEKKSTNEYEFELQLNYENIYETISELYYPVIKNMKSYDNLNYNSIISRIEKLLMKGRSVFDTNKEKGNMFLIQNKHFEIITINLLISVVQMKFNTNINDNNIKEYLYYKVNKCLRKLYKLGMMFILFDNKQKKTECKKNVSFAQLCMKYVTSFLKEKYMKLTKKALFTKIKQITEKMNHSLISITSSFISVLYQNTGTLFIEQNILKQLQNIEKYSLYLSHKIKLSYETILTETKDILLSLKNNLSQIKTPYLPPMNKSKYKFTLVVDLDETLVHFDYDNNKTFVHVRPFTEYFLNKLGDLFEIVIFTAAIEEYAKYIINKIDQKNKIAYKLYRKHTLYKEKENILIKDLTKLGRDLNKICIIDNHKESFSLQPQNGLEILSFYDDENDKELYYLANDLYQMHHAEDSDIIHHLEKIRKEMKKRYTLK